MNNEHVKQSVHVTTSMIDGSRALGGVERSYSWFVRIDTQRCLNSALAHCTLRFALSFAMLLTNSKNHLVSSLKPRPTHLKPARARVPASPKFPTFDNLTFLLSRCSSEYMHCSWQGLVLCVFVRVEAATLHF